MIVANFLNFFHLGVSHPQQDSPTKNPNIPHQSRSLEHHSWLYVLPLRYTLLLELLQLLEH